MPKVVADSKNPEAASQRLATFLREQGLRQTHQRDVIVRALFDEDRHLSVDEIYGKVQEMDSKIGYSTVYRTLKILTNAGIAHEHRFKDGVTRFEPNNPTHHHDHLICTACRTIVEFECEEIEGLQDQVAADHGFRLSHHTHELYGLCEACQAEGS